MPSYKKIKLDKEMPLKQALKSERRTSLLMTRLSNRAFLILLAIEVLGLFFAGYFFLINAAKKELGSAQEEVSAAREEYVQLSQKYAQIVKINSLYQSLDKKLIERANLILPTQPNLFNMLVNLDALVQGNGFTLKTVSFTLVDEKNNRIYPVKKIDRQGLAAIRREGMNSAAMQDLAKAAEFNFDTISGQPSKTLKNIQTEIEVEGGGYYGVKKLISQIESNLRLFDVKQFVFSPTDTSFKINLKAYFYN